MSRVNVSSEVEIRREMVKKFREILTKYHGRTISRGLLDEIADSLKSEMTRLLQASRDPNSDPKFHIQQDPLERTALQLIPLNDAAFWLIALSGEDLH